MLRDEEAAGSNPVTPTNEYGPSNSNEGRSGRVQQGSTAVEYSSCLFANDYARRCHLAALSITSGTSPFDIRIVGSAFPALREVVDPLPTFGRAVPVAPRPTAAQVSTRRQVARTIGDAIGQAVVALATTGMIMVADDTDRENEGDLIMAAGAITPEQMAFFLRQGSGIVRGLALA